MLSVSVSWTVQNVSCDVLQQHFQIFLENLSLLKSLFFSPTALIYDSVCVRACVRACVCARARVRVVCVEF